MRPPATSLSPMPTRIKSTHMISKLAEPSGQIDGPAPALSSRSKASSQFSAKSRKSTDAEGRGAASVLLLQERPNVSDAAALNFVTCQNVVDAAEFYRKCFPDVGEAASVATSEISDSSFIR